jgi:hypothetical protein
MSDKLVEVQIKTLAGIALDWVIAKCEGFNPETPSSLGRFPMVVERINEDGSKSSNFISQMRYSTDRERSGLIVERELISVMYDSGDWIATMAGVDYDELEDKDYPFGATPSVAAMRCFAMAKLGATVEVPEQLLILSVAEVESSMSTGDKHGLGVANPYAHLFTTPGDAPKP